MGSKNQMAEIGPCYLSGGITMDKIKLRPCPFCGAKAVYKIVSVMRRDREVGWEYTVECSMCEIKLHENLHTTVTLYSDGTIANITDEREKAAERWNRRADHAK